MFAASGPNPLLLFVKSRFFLFSSNVVFVFVFLVRRTKQEEYEMELEAVEEVFLQERDAMLASNKVHFFVAVDFTSTVVYMKKVEPTIHPLL